VGENLASSPLLLTAVSSPVESNLLDLKRKNNQFCDTMNSIL